MAVVEGSIKLITEKKYAELIKTYVWPAEVEKLTARFGSVDNAAEPGFERDGTIARFQFTAPIGRDTALKLEKLNGRWYLRD